MPAVREVFFQRAPGNSLVVEWLRELNRASPRALDKCRAAVAPARRRLGMPRRSTTDATRILAGIAGPSAARRRAFAEECAHREVARRLAMASACAVGGGVWRRTVSRPSTCGRKPLGHEVIVVDEDVLHRRVAA